MILEAMSTPVEAWVAENGRSSAGLGGRGSRVQLPYLRKLPKWRLFAPVTRLTTVERQDWYPGWAVGRTTGSFRIEEGRMLWTIFVILLVLWLLGVVTSYTLGGFIHVLLVIAVVLAIMQLLQGRRAL
jgi:Family of unknown function (DUF5670)